MTGKKKPAREMTSKELARRLFPRDVRREVAREIRESDEKAEKAEKSRASKKSASTKKKGT